MRESTRSFLAKGGHAVLRGMKVILRAAARMIGRIACMLLCIAVSVCLAHALIPNLIQDVLGFTRAQEINDTVIREELTAISELATYEFTYVNHVDYVDQPQLLGCNVWLTDHRFAFDYHGVIKAGYSDLAKIDLLWVDSVEQSMGIYLPEVSILSNEIFIDMATYEEQNNLCNPLEPRQVLEYLYSRKEPELQEALDQGLLEKARENAKSIISRVMAAMGYTVDFRD